MKVIRCIMNILTLISAIVCLYTIISVGMDIMVDNDVFLQILLYNLFASPILTIITSLSNLNREEK